MYKEIVVGHCVRFPPQRNARSTSLMAEWSQHVGIKHVSAFGREYRCRVVNLF